MVRDVLVVRFYYVLKQKCSSQGASLQISHVDDPVFTNDSHFLFFCYAGCIVILVSYCSIFVFRLIVLCYFFLLLLLLVSWLIGVIIIIFLLIIAFEHLFADLVVIWVWPQMVGISEEQIQKHVSTVINLTEVLSDVQADLL